MSDDDLWRPRQPAGSEPADDAHQDAPPTQPVSDETQPITGLPPTPPAPPPAPAPAPSGPSPTYGAPSGPAAVPPPYNPYVDPKDPYAQGPPQGQPGYQGPGYPGQAGYQGQPGYQGGPGLPPPPNPYPAPNEFGQPASPYGSPYQPAYAGGQLPDHPSATTAMVLGIIGLVGILFCAGITLLLSPAAWVVGAKAVREIDAAPGRYAGRDRAQAGKIMGIIGTVLLVLGVLAIVAFVVLVVAVGSTGSGTNQGFQPGGA